MSVRRHFYTNLDGHDNISIGLYDEWSVWSFPGFGIIIIIDVFHFLESTQVLIPLKSLHMKFAAQFEISNIIFGVIKSFSGFSSFLITFTISRARNKTGSLVISVRSDGRSNEFAAAFGWNIFRRCWANVSVLSSGRPQQILKCC